MGVEQRDVSKYGLPVASRARHAVNTPTGFHLEIEKYLEASGLAWSQLRPTGFIQEYLPALSVRPAPARAALATCDPKKRPGTEDSADAAARLVPVGKH
jgi:hypothetical protein